MTALLGLLALAVAFLIAGAIPVDGGAQTVIFRTPVFRLILAVLAGSLVVVCVRKGRSWRAAPFWLTHLGVAIVLAGAGLGAWRGIRGDLAVPITERHAVRELRARDGGAVPLGFGLSVTNFRVEHYDPQYRLFRPPRTEAGERPDAYVPMGDFAVSENRDLVLEAYGSVPVAQLKDESRKAWIPQLALTNGWVLQLSRQTPRGFHAVLTLDVPDGPNVTKDLLINRPVLFRGWRLYLMSYEMEPQPYVLIHVRRDPGRCLVVFGIWMVILGIAWMCWRRGARPSPVSAEGGG